MLSLFSVAAFGLAIVGLVSVVGLDVTRRRHELAIRLALGAQRRDIVGRVLGLAGWRVLLGVGLGLVMAIAAARAARSLLFGVDAVDPATYAGVVILVAAVVTVASYVPARRAAGIDPLALLRRE